MLVHLYRAGIKYAVVTGEFGFKKERSETGGEAIGNFRFLLLVELVYVVFEFMDPGTDRENDAAIRLL